MVRTRLRSAIADRFRRRPRKAQDDGATAIEFALIATPFFIMIFGLIEVCLIIFMSAMLEFGASQAARDIKTGIFQSSGSADQLALKQRICESAGVIPNCISRIQLDVKKLNSFSSAGSSPVPFDSTGEFNGTGVSFDIGYGNDIMVVRAFYPWPLFTPLLTRPLANLGTDKRLLTSVMVFKNEPF